MKILADLFYIVTMCAVLFLVPPVVGDIKTRTVTRKDATYAVVSVVVWIVAIVCLWVTS